MQNAAETVQHTQAENCYSPLSQNNRRSVSIYMTYTEARIRTHQHTEQRPKLTSPPKEKNTFICLVFNCLTSLAPSSFLFSCYFFIHSPVSSSFSWWVSSSPRSLPFVLPVLTLLFSTPLYSDCCVALLLSTPSLDCFFLASSAPVGAFSVISPFAPSLHLAITLLPLDTNPTPSLPSSPFLSLSGSKDGVEYTVQLSLSYSVANDNIFYPIIFFCTPSLWFSLIFTLFFSFNPVHPLPPPYLCLAQKLKPWGFWVPS